MPCFDPLPQLDAERDHRKVQALTLLLCKVIDDSVFGRKPLDTDARRWFAAHVTADAFRSAGNTAQDQETSRVAEDILLSVWARRVRGIK